MCDDIQFGIVSGGIGCGLRGFAGTYTNIEKYYEFIYHTIGGSSSVSLLNLPKLLLFIVINFMQ